MNLLISGPPASGKSRLLMEQFRSHPGSLLIVPTATMVEHVRHSLARSGFPLRPRDVCTLAHFLDERSPAAAAPAPLLDWLIEKALERLRTQQFVDVAVFPGFRRALAALFEQMPAEVLPPNLADLEGEVQASLEAYGMALRHTRLRNAAESLQTATLPANVLLDGFFTLSAEETELVVGLARRTAVTITLPDWPGSEAVRTKLRAGGLTEQRLPAVRRTASRGGFSTATIGREVEEIARRILVHAAEGRDFREIGIILRSREPYAGLVETVLARFGIPAKFYFHGPLASHPALTYFSLVMRSMLEGWDHATLLAAVRMPVSGLGATPAGDQLDFAWRDRIPAVGLPLPGGLENFSALDSWRRDRLEPLEWSDRLKTLRKMLPQPEVGDGADREQMMAWRSTAAALAGFEQVLDSTAEALAGSGRCALPLFWKYVENALSLEPLRVPDARRNVVHVMDVYEARQWELPVVFVCGLIERHFPQYHREDPILGLVSAADRQKEEQLLFDLATTRATERTILSYPRFDDTGEETLRSFFVGDEFPPVNNVPAVPRTAPPGPPDVLPGPVPSVFPKSLSPTAIESFLQCPFQFFAGKTLRLRRRPPAPRDRLDLLVQGSILHRALAEVTCAPLLGRAILDQIFEDECIQRRIPEGYRTEAVRLELMRHFRGFLADDRFLLRDWKTRVEEKFSFALNPHVTINGRIDRLEVGPGKQAVVIDYKYSAANKIRERVDDTGDGDAVQGGLYLAAAKRSFGLEPAGMLFCGLKKEVNWGGWHVDLPSLAGVGRSATREVLHGLMEDAERAAIEVHEAVTAGDIAVRPSDRKKCAWCDYRDICRVETAVLVQVAR